MKGTPLKDPLLKEHPFKENPFKRNPEPEICPLKGFPRLRTLVSFTVALASVVAGLLLESLGVQGLRFGT